MCPESPISTPSTQSRCSIQALAVHLSDSNTLPFTCGCWQSSPLPALQSSPPRGSRDPLVPSTVWALTLPHNLWEHLTQLSVFHRGLFWGLSAWIILYPKPPRLLFYERMLLKANSLLFPGARHTFIFGTKSAFKRKAQNLPSPPPAPR